MVDSLASQTVAMIQLSTEEKERYKGCHVYLDFDSGFYTFPVSSFLLSFFCSNPCSASPRLASHLLVRQ